jgi:hypothetical protein
MKHRPLLLLVLVGLVALPQQAFANVGTPLVWAGTLHLVIGNALIGFLEGILLSSLGMAGWIVHSRRDCECTSD